MGLFSRTLSRLDELKKVLTKDPGSRQFLALADEYRRQGQAREAIEVLEKGLAQNPGAVAGHVALGRLRQQAGRLDDAVSSFQAALKLDPQNLVALRQLGELYLARGEKVEAIKKLKLFRGLSPGDRDVNDQIRQLEGDLSVPAAPRVPALPDISPPLPPVEFLTGSTSRIAIPAPAAPPPPLPMPAPPELPRVAPLPVEAASEAERFVPYSEPDVAPDEPSLEVPPVETEAVPTEVPGFLFDQETEPAGEASEPPSPEAQAAAPSGPAEAPAVTETLAELLRAQGHLGDARQAYEELARTESDAERAERLRAVADEIAAARGGTLRGRLEEWSRPFSRRCVPRDTDLVTAVEHAVERLGRASAVVTDFEGVPVVSAGPRGDSEAMEILAAELTAFWKNVRRSRSEIGEGALDSLVLSGTSGTAAVKVITPAYALLVKAGPGIPAGRIRFEAARAAEQLRPALL